MRFTKKSFTIEFDQTKLNLRLKWENPGMTHPTITSKNYSYWGDTCPQILHREVSVHSALPCRSDYWKRRD